MLPPEECIAGPGAPFLESSSLAPMGVVLMLDRLVFICGVWDAIARICGLRGCESIHQILQMNVPSILKEDLLFHWNWC